MGDRVAVLRAGFFSNATAPRCSTTARARLRGRVHGFARYEPIWGETPDGAVSAVVGTQRLALPESLLASGPGLGTYASSVRMRWSPAPKTSRARSRVPARASPESSFVPSSSPARGCASSSTRPRSVSSTRRAARRLFGDGALSVIAEVAGRAFVMCAGVGALGERAWGWTGRRGQLWPKPTPEAPQGIWLGRRRWSLLAESQPRSAHPLVEEGREPPRAAAADLRPHRLQEGTRGAARGRSTGIGPKLAIEP
jgi:hypothetical protein